MSGHKRKKVVSIINDIVSAISTNIYNEFGGQYEIYTEQMEQGFLQPCFYISNVKSDIKVLLNNRYKQENSFCIKFYTNDSNTNLSCNDVAIRLYSTLEFITNNETAKMLHGTKMTYEVVDGVLNFYVNYNTVYCIEEEKTIMETMSSKTKI